MEKSEFQRNSLIRRILGGMHFFSESFLELLFPRCCIACGNMGELVCEKCFKEIELRSLQVCFLCEKAITKSGELCSSCKLVADPPINRLLVGGKYEDELLSKAVHLFKYKFVKDLDEPLGKLLLKTLKHFSVPIPDFIMPVPLHPRRLRWRGYNQSSVLAKQLSQNMTPGMEIPVLEDIVIRSRYTMPQMKIKKFSLRRKNIVGAFKLDQNAHDKVRRKHILLVDDVCTTGSTIFECAKELQNLHPKSITAIVLARQG